VGKFGNGGSFDGSEDYVSVDAGSASTLSIRNSITLSAWVKIDAQTAVFKYFVRSENVGGYTTYELYKDDNNKPFFSIWSSQTQYKVNSNFTMQAGMWYHVSGIYNGNQLEIYVNGDLKNSRAASGLIDALNGTTITLAGRNGDGTKSLNGTQDETRIYNRALSAAEVRQLYNFAPGPVAHWKFDDGSGTSVTDSSGNGNTGTWYGSGNHWVAGKQGKAGGFNGGNDYFRARVPGSSDFTFQFWMKPDAIGVSSGNHQFLVANPQMGLAGGKLSYYDSQAGNPVGTTTFTAGTWYFITWVRSETVTKAYINASGKADLTASNSVALNTLSGAYLFSYNGSSQFYGGLIDDVKIYNYARTADQIMEDMQSRAGPVSVNAVSAAGKGTLIDLKMDEGSGTTTKDSSGNGKNGTLNDGAAWSQNGKYGRGIQLDGSNDDVSVADFSY